MKGLRRHAAPCVLALGLWAAGALHAEDTGPLPQQPAPATQPAQPAPFAQASPAAGLSDSAAAAALADALPSAEELVVGEGIASWYGPRFHGRRTASGEVFDMHALTAAHRSLPFGSLVEVRSLVNGRSVHVRINDRGPFTGQRIIDLSRGAAEALGLLQSGQGLKPVVLRLLRLGDAQPQEQAPRRRR